MPIALMEKMEEGTSSFSGSESQSPQSWGTEQPGENVHQRRQRNRDAARRSRRKQTERADQLHEELQALEQSNAAYVKEINELEKELQHYTITLKEHEPHCTLQCWPGPSVTTTTSTSDICSLNITQTQIEKPSCGPEFPFLPSPVQDAVASFCLTDVLDRNDWLPWDSEDM